MVVGALLRGLIGLGSQNPAFYRGPISRTIANRKKKEHYHG